LRVCLVGSLGINELLKGARVKSDKERNMVYVHTINQQKPAETKRKRFRFRLDRDKLSGRQLATVFIFTVGFLYTNLL